MSAIFGSLYRNLQDSNVWNGLYIPKCIGRVRLGYRKGARSMIGRPCSLRAGSKNTIPSLSIEASWLLDLQPSPKGVPAPGSKIASKGGDCDENRRFYFPSISSIDSSSNFNYFANIFCTIPYYTSLKSWWVNIHIWHCLRKPHTIAVRASGMRKRRQPWFKRCQLLGKHPAVDISGHWTVCRSCIPILLHIVDVYSFLKSNSYVFWWCSNYVVLAVHVNVERAENNNVRGFFWPVGLCLERNHIWPVSRSIPHV